MAPLSERDALLAAWRGLTADGTSGGWQSIPLGAEGGLEIRAARVFPDGDEAFLVGRSGAAVPGEHSLPQARGFRSMRLASGGSGCAWFAVVRNQGGSLDLFASMASDVLSLLYESAGTTGKTLQRVIARVASWQRFMERGGDDLLSPEEEVGLFGELAMLRALLDGEADPAGLCACWTGPLGALHDFRFGSGAMEVKTTVLGTDAHARIAGLWQLDTAVTSPLFLVAVRLVQAEIGATLGDLAEEIRFDIIRDADAGILFGDRLLAAGLQPSDHEHYRRRFVVDSIRVHSVKEGFPRLTPATTPAAVIAARYTIDLDQLTPEATTPAAALELLRNA
ncbi:hypothetical protein ASG60_18320 [Methylobacterium sp. Leaf469]|uniref:PD-(D/E)XK motif protein n=1 Tax=Methylobacterium sp. Leaf469 TaxID=1736387 RepID=UPI0006F6BD56|nr:PD-(D/E)XK motif protein [Methylobacterium sp. Leaf469]KQU01809.1 hypothetical protein ASG60_18320 [Methylobacterium sp. Leaf469]